MIGISRFNMEHENHQFYDQFSTWYHRYYEGMYDIDHFESCLSWAQENPETFERDLPPIDEPLTGYLRLLMRKAQING